MGEIVGAALVSHVPPLVMSEADRRDLNDGKDTSLYEGLHQLRSTKLDTVGADTIVVFDTHWFTTVEHVIASHPRRSGLFTSSELPRGMSQMPYDFPGDPELAHAVAGLADQRDDAWVTAIDDPHLPIYYATINLLPFLQNDERWMSVGVVQTGEPYDFLLFGELLRQAIASLDRRVVLLASGGLSHRFWPLREFRDHEGAGLEHIRTQQAREADEKVLAWMRTGDHGAIIDFVPEYSKHAPEGHFAHYLMMVGALGGANCTARGTQFGDYESVGGTGGAHVWFDL
ncbi:MAG: catechol 1,2-dioxygenase [Acidimicrobiales bacterium]